MFFFKFGQRKMLSKKDGDTANSTEELF